MRSSSSSRRYSLAFLVLMACLGSGPVKAQDNTGKKASAIVGHREKAIAKEVAASTDEWTGEYYYGDGLGVNVTLRIGRTSGFVFTWYGCMGLYDQNYGDVRREDGRLRLVPALPNDPSKGFQGIAEDFYQVLWGTRHYLVPVDRMINFANAVNAGSEPRETNFSSSFLLKKGDEKKRVTGRPPIPAGYSDYLLSVPLEAQISSVGASRTRDLWRVDAVTLNVGREEGVREGMEFFLVEPDFATAKVTKVADHTCEAELEQYGKTAVDPTPQWKLTTRLRSDSGS